MKYLHFVYETTNTIDGKIYIGKHSTVNLNDNYLGSGKVLSRAIKKHGRKVFTRKILKTFKTSEEAFEYERELVTSEFIERSDTYNLSIGGDGNTSEQAHLQFKKMWENPDTREKLTTERRERCEDPNYLKKMSKIGKEVWERPEHREQRSKDTKLRSADPEVKQNMIDAQKGIRWVTDGKVNKRVRPHSFLINNSTWRIGRTEESMIYIGKGSVNVTDGISNKRLPESEVEDFLKQNPDFYFGQRQSNNRKKRDSSANAKKKCVNNGVRNKYVVDLEEFLAENPSWLQGMAPRSV